jgi:hypothetical protein
VGPSFRRSTVRCLKIAAASAALHRDPHCVSDDRPFGFQISRDQGVYFSRACYRAAQITGFTARTA